MATLESSLKYCRISTAVLAFIILVIGLNSHYRSTWVSLHYESESADDLQKASKLHELCEIRYFYGNCPDILLEQSYIAVICISFIFSLLGILTFCLWYQNAETFHPLKWLDLIYHAISALILLTASILYIVSAVQVKEFSNQEGVDFPTLNYRTEEKFVAGSLTILQAILHMTIAILIGKCKKPIELVDDTMTMTTIGNGHVNLGMS